MFARSLPQLASLRPHLPRILGWLGLAAALAGWFWVALGPWMIGPSEWDDTMYAERAITAGFVWDVRNRYAHVWAIRILDFLAPSHRSAAAAWGALCVCGLAGLAFYAGQRIAGMRCGFAALALTLLFPPMLKYLSVPHVDFSMALFSMLAVLAAALAVDASSPRVARVAAVACGVFGYLALKSKETGLAALPVCAYVLFGAARGRAKWQSYALWIAGLALGFALLYALDRAFFHAPVQHASDPTSYFAQTPKTTQPAAPHNPRAYRPGEHEAELMSVLLSPAFAAFTLLGCAGLVHTGRRNVWARALAAWCLAVLAFTALVSVRYRGVDAQDRYLVAVGAALAPLAASWLLELARGGQRHPASLVVFGLMVLVTAPALWGTWAVHLGTASDLQARAASLTTPLAMLFLFLAAWFTPRRWIALPAACVLIGISGLAVVDDARAYREQKRSELAPWIELAGWADAAPEPVSIAVLNGRSYRAARLRWRLRVLSRQSLLDVHLRDIDRADQLEPGEWVFVGAARDKGLEERGYQRVLDLTRDPRPWSLYRRY
jgi:hypothetical protein